MNTKATGYILGAVAAATYGMNPLFALPLYQAGMDPDSVLFLRYLLAIPILGIMLKARGRSFKLKRKEILPLIGMGLLVSVSSLTLFQSYNYMAAGIASTLLFVYPILVALIMTVVFREKLTILTILCIALALCGIGMLYEGEDGATLNLTGVILVMASALTYALYIVGVKNIKTIRHIKTDKLSFYVMLFGLLVYIYNLKFCTQLQFIDKPFLWLCTFGLALFPTIISLETINISIKLIGSTKTAILGALEPMTAIFFGILFFNEHLTIRISIGIILIIAGVYLIVTQKSDTNSKHISDRFK